MNKLPYKYQMNDNGEVLAKIDETRFLFIDPRDFYPEVRVMSIALLGAFEKQNLRQISKSVFEISKMQAEREIDKLKNLIENPETPEQK